MTPLEKRYVTTLNDIKRIKVSKSEKAKHVTDCLHDFLSGMRFAISQLMSEEEEEKFFEVIQKEAE